jgi:FKBP-type peptidyl-prolyl cis-trans isomerase FklB
MKRLNVRLVVAAVLGSCLLAGPATFGETTPPASEETRLGYSVGYQVGKDIRLQQFDIDTEMLIRGVLDALSGSAPLMSERDMERELVRLRNAAQVPTGSEADKAE